MLLVLPSYALGFCRFSPKILLKHDSVVTCERQAVLAGGGFRVVEVQGLGLRVLHSFRALPSQTRSAAAPGLNAKP